MVGDIGVADIAYWRPISSVLAAADDVEDDCACFQSIVGAFCMCGVWYL